MKKYRRNRLFYTNQGRFYKDFESENVECQTTPNAEEFMAFYNTIWSNPTEHRRDTEWLKYVRQKCETEEQ